jgi:hypothetical protein
MGETVGRPCGGGETRLGRSGDTMEVHSIIAGVSSQLPLFRMSFGVVERLEERLVGGWASAASVMKSWDVVMAPNLP